MQGWARDIHILAVFKVKLMLYCCHMYSAICVLLLRQLQSLQSWPLHCYGWALYSFLWLFFWNCWLSIPVIITEGHLKPREAFWRKRPWPTWMWVLLGLCVDCCSCTSCSFWACSCFQCVLAQPISWCVQTKALLQRTHWETESPRRMQRSLAQLEVSVPYPLWPPLSSP